MTAIVASIDADPDWEVRLAAFAELARLVARHGPVLPWHVIEGGFEAGGHQLRFANQTKGIFRPAGMLGGALSIKTTVPRRGKVGRYVDLASDGAFSYAVQDRGPDYHDNKLLLWCARAGVPVVYLYGIAPGHYRPIWPAYVQVDQADQDRVLVTTAPAEAPMQAPGTGAADRLGQLIERRYATIEAKRRLHQDAFRHLVLEAYVTRCAICNLPRRELVDAAHIVPDRDARGEPSVANGLALCKLHHSAYDANLLGIRPDCIVEISRALLEVNDGPTLEIALKGVAGRALQAPRRIEQRPSVELLEERYEVFRRSA